MYSMEDLVKQATTTTGTGDLTLGASQIGLRDFGSALTDLDYLTYEVHGVDVNGQRTGQFETGIGQYHLDGSVHKLRRCLVITNSSGTQPSPLNFSSGTKHVYITPTSAQARGVKISDMGEEGALYVRADGDDENSGFSDSSGGAFLTLQQAADVAMECFTRSVIIVGSGSFGSIALVSDDGNPRNVQLIGAGRANTTIDSVYVGQNVTASVFDVSIVTDSRGVTVDGAAAVFSTGEYNEASAMLSFGACDNGHVLAKNGGRVAMMDYHVGGGCSSGPHIEIVGSGTSALLSGEQTVDANVTISGGWVKGRGPCYIDFLNNTFVLGGHTVTGARYDLQGNAVCDTHAGGASYLPGNSAGTTATGGQYL